MTQKVKQKAQKNKQKVQKIKQKEDYPLVMTVDHVQEILGIGRRVAYELFDQKGFPAVKIGRLKRVNREAFFKWLDNKVS